MSCATCSSTQLSEAKYVSDGGGSVWLVVDQIIIIIIITTTMCNTGGYVTRTENNTIITPIFMITPYSARSTRLCLGFLLLF